MTIVHPLTITGVITAFSVLVLGGLVLGRDPRRKLYRVFFVLTLAVAVWGFGTSMIALSPNKTVALFWIRFHEIGLFLIPAAFYHFIVEFTAPVRRGTFRKYAWISGYVGSATFLALGQTGLFVRGVEVQRWGYYPVAGTGTVTFTFFFAAYIFLALYELARGYTASTGRLRNQMKYAAIAFAVGFVPGLANFLPFYGVRIPYLVANITAPVAVLILAYAIVKHRLMDVNVIVRKSAVYSILTAAVAAAYVGTVFGLQQVFQTLTGYKSALPAIVVALLIALTFEPVRRNVQLFVDKTFFRKKYEYQQVIKSASETLRATVSPRKTASVLLQTVVDTLQVSSGLLMLFDRPSERYSVAASIGMPEDVSYALSFGGESRMVEFLTHVRQAVWLDDPERKVLARRVDKDERRKIEELGVQLVMPLHGKSELVGMLFLGEKRSGDICNQDDVELLTMLCDQAAVTVENSRLYDEIQASYLNTIRSLVAALEAKDEYTRGHSERVAKYAREIAKQMGLSQSESQLLYEVSLLHDVGKIGISEEILNKPARLSETEFDMVRSHALTGERILSSIESLRDGLPIIRHHHERLNGGGYPDGLSEADIPLPARILAVADAFDAMTTKRPYRPAMTARGAIAELKKFSCHQFDPHVVRAFLAVLVRQRGILWPELGITGRPVPRRHSRTA